MIDQTKTERNVPVDIDAICWLMRLPQSHRRQLLVAIAECSEQIQCIVFSQVDIIDDSSSTDLEKQRAYNTIRSALEMQPFQESFGFDIEQHEATVAFKDQDVARVTDNLDSQESGFYERLEKILRSKRLPQIELAKRLGMSQPAISQMLTRKCRPQRRTIVRFAKALEVDPRELWPDLDVAGILDTAAAVQQDQPMTEAEANAIERALKGKSATTPAKPLPKRKS
ncbi:MAG: helix-turn-helix transcriptional regulator [Pirellulaceae bacterium]